MEDCDGAQSLLKGAHRAGGAVPPRGPGAHTAVPTWAHTEFSLLPGAHGGAHAA